MPARRPLLAPLVLALASACASADAGTGAAPDDTNPPTTPARRIGGPLANAGPDRQVLEGQVVRLDAGSSQAGEAGRPLRYLWYAVPGPDGAVPLAIDDPGARRVRVVAPILPDGVERADVRLALRVDDGVDRAEDEVRLEVVRGPATAIAPVASAGPDRQVRAGEEVTIGPRPGDDSIVDPACLGEGCPAPEVTWTLVEGRGATFRAIDTPAPEDGCVAPCARVATDASLLDGAVSEDVVAVLSFRVDVVSGTTGLAAAPDFVRIFVKRNDNYERTPNADLDPPREDSLPWYVGTSDPQQASGSADEPVRGFPLGFRPILGEAEPVPGDYYGSHFEYPAPDSPALLGWAFEGRRSRFTSAPRFLLVDWRGLPAPTAEAGPDPVHLVDGAPVPPDGCDRVRLIGAGPALASGLTVAAACDQGRADPALEFCWTQTFGPAALAGSPRACGERADTFDAGSQLAGCDSDLACPDLVVPPPAGEDGRVLAFSLQVRQRAHGDVPASAWSPPDTAVVHVVAGSRDDPPEARLALSRRLGDGSLVPLAGPVAPGATVVVDAAGSFDPEGQPLAFAVESPEGGLAFAPYEPCPAAGACFAAVAPAVAASTTFPLVITVAAGATSTVCGGTGGGGVCLDRAGNPLDAPAVVVDAPAAP